MVQIVLGHLQIQLKLGFLLLQVDVLSPKLTGFLKSAKK
jgi:hypothetical protein